MIDSVLEFITKAASSSAFIFCFCNLIIVIILIDLKPTRNFDQGSKIPESMVRNTATNDKQEKNSKHLVGENKGSPESAKVSPSQEALAVDEIEKGNDNCSNEEEKEEEEDGDDDDDELRRRVEEFIEKVNKAWKAEMLSTPRQSP